VSAIAITPAEVIGALNDVESKHAPSQLFLAGNRDLLLRGGRRVSVIGSRNASSQGLRRARVIAKSLVEHGIVVVSGLASGVDRAAHDAAIASGGQTIAVIGTPLDRCYPNDNSELQRRIAREQLLISQFPTGHPMAPKNFPMRNRTMALLTDATVIAEATEKSGALLQGWETLRLGRLLFVLESAATDPTLTWPKDLIQDGAQVLSRENLDIAWENLPAFTAATTIATEA
jgi:DNA processing protein